MTDAIFQPVHGEFLPTDLARGPWDTNALHAGATAALIVREIERVEPPGQMTRITIDLPRPTPASPLRVEVSETQSGKQVQRFHSEVWSGSRLVARAEALFIRREPLELEIRPEWIARPGEAVPPPPPTTRVQNQQLHTSHVGFHNEGMDIRFVRGSFTEPGHAVAWYRMNHPLLPGEEPSPLSRLLAAADFINGSSTVLSWHDYVFINADLTVYVSRPPVGEWVALDAVTRPGAEGAGFTEAQLFDEEGPIGRAQQSLLVLRAS